MTIKILALHDDLLLPEFELKAQTEGSAGMDVRAMFSTEETLEERKEDTITLYPGECYDFPLGFATEFDPNTAVLVLARSGLGSRGLNPRNLIPLVDSDYRGELVFKTQNTGDEILVIHHGDRIGQLLHIPIVHPAVELVEELSETDRGAGGWGSTG